MKAIQNVNKLSGNNFKLWKMLRARRGVSEPEGCEALGWKACGATLLRLRRAAEAAGYVVETSRGADGRARWKARRGPKPGPVTA